jgi:phosphatidylglycerol---prolipoprotein diacylglyceryl transferase
VKPELFSAFGIAFPSYFVLLVTGFFFATACAVLWARRVGQEGDVMVDLGLAMLIAGVAGARILHVLADGHFLDYVHLCTDPSAVDWHVSKARCLSHDWNGRWDDAAQLCHPSQTDCFAWAKFWAGGLTYYGGFIGASLGSIALLRRDKFPFWKAADMAGFTVPLGLAFGRVGCFLAGCCFGAPSDVFCAIRFPGGSPASEAQAKAHLLAGADLRSLAVHPTQVYESLGSLAVAAVCLWWVHPRKRYDGQVFVAFLVLYAIVRFLLEFLRRDERGGALALSTSQLLGFAMVAAALAIHFRRKRPVR